MAGTPANPYGFQSGVGGLWHAMDWLLRVDFVVLGLLLAFTFVLVVRVSRCYRLALAAGTESPSGKIFVAELKIHTGHLKSIASTATYFGLLGTCLGILSTFGGSATSKPAFIAWITSTMAAALVPCAAGIIVAVPATCGHVYGQTRLSLLAGLPPSRSRRPRRRLAELPSFALIAAWLLALLIRVFFLPFTPMNNFKGFDVGVAPVPCGTLERSVVLRLSNRGKIFLNLEEERDWRSLQSRLSEIYRMREDRVLYLSADEGVPFRTVADALDNVRNIPENITVQLVTPRAVNAGCPESRPFR